jgi:hypothetical protein
MNRKLLLSALALLAAAAGPVAADDITPEPPFTSTRTRAEVMAQLRDFQRTGVNPWADGYDQLAHFTSRKTRAQVTAEFMGARDEVAALNAEDSGSAYLKDRSRMLAGPVFVDPILDGPILAGQPQNPE